MRTTKHLGAQILTLFFMAFACGADPVYDTTIGVAAIPAEVGAHAGTFALKTVSTTLVHVPIFGDKNGGGSNYRLVKRTYNAKEKIYSQSSELCGGENFEVAGVTTAAPEETYRLVPPSEKEIVTIDHDKGTYVGTGHIQLWALKDMPDPVTSTLPKGKKQAKEAPFKDYIYDMDGDGKDGVTMKISGIVNGEVYVIQRKFVDLSGIILGPDRAIGLASNSYTTIILGDDISIYDPKDGSAETHPDPKLSWFEEIRMPETSTCDDVMAALQSGQISLTRPF